MDKLELLVKNVLEGYKSKCLVLVIFHVLSFVFKDRFKKETGSEWINNRYGQLLKKNLTTFNKLDRDDQKLVSEGSLSFMTPQLLVELMINYPFKSIDKSVLDQENKIIEQFTSLISEHNIKFNQSNPDYNVTRVKIIKQLQLLSSYNGDYYSSKTILYLMNTTQLESVSDEGIPFQVGNKKALEIISLGNQYFDKQNYKKAIKVYEEVQQMFIQDQNQLSFYTYSLGFYSSAKAWLMLYIKEPMYPKYLDWAKVDIEYALKRRPMAPEMWFLYGCILSLINSTTQVTNQVVMFLTAHQLDKDKQVPQISKVLELKASPQFKSNLISIIKSYFIDEKRYSNHNNNNNNNNSNSNQNNNNNSSNNNNHNNHNNNNNNSNSNQHQNSSTTNQKNNNKTYESAQEGTWGIEVLNEKSNSSRIDYSLSLIATKPKSVQAQLLFTTIRNKDLFLNYFNDGINFKDSKSPDYVIRILYNTLKLESYAVILPDSTLEKVLTFLNQYLNNNSKNQKKFAICLEVRLSILGLAFNDGYSLLNYKQLIEESIKLHPDEIEFKFYSAMFKVFMYKPVDDYKDSLEELKQCHLKSPSNLKYLYYYTNCMSAQMISPDKIIPLVSSFINLSPIDGWKRAECYFFLGSLYLLVLDFNKGLLAYIKGKEIESIHLSCYDCYFSGLNNYWRSVFERNIKSMLSIS